MSTRELQAMRVSKEVSPLILRYFHTYFPMRHITREVREGDSHDWIMTPKTAIDSRNLIHALVWAYQRGAEVTANV